MKWNVWHIPSSRWLSYKSWGRKQRAIDYREFLIEHKDHAPAALEVRPVYPMLETNGTKLMQLKPKMIWDCAMADLGRRERNKQAHVSDIEPYAFHRKHVEKAASANDIIRAAIKDIGRGQRSSKRDTRLLYSDVELLQKALQ